MRGPDGAVGDPPPVNRDLLRRAARLLEGGSPYAVATVVRCERPTSGKPGNTAVITPDGVMHGWIGGSCTQSEVIRHALEALEAGEPRLLACGSSAGRPDDLVHVPMSCSSGGNVEIHINPVLPPPVLLVVGASPVGHALLRLGGVVGYATVAGTPTDAAMAEAAGSVVDDLAGVAERYAGRPGGAKLFAVVATMGESDEQALWHLVAARPDYLGVVASHKRMEHVRSVLAAQGVSERDLCSLHGPAGLDIGAGTPEEIAVSILAEIVERGARPAAEAVGDEAPLSSAEAGEEIVPGPAGKAESSGWATDPVCGMTVPVAGSPSSVVEGEPVYFCCDGCRSRFEATPELFPPKRSTPDTPWTARKGSSAPVEPHG